MNNQLLRSKKLLNKNIFISASIPLQDRNEIYWKDTKSLDIMDAVVEIVKKIFSHGGSIIFGGHPSISPLILTIGEKFLPVWEKNKIPFVKIYQSEFFKFKISSFTMELVNKQIGEIIWTKEIENLRDESLELMRKTMIDENDPIAAIFIGGMEGIEEEFNIFSKKYPNRPFYIIGSTGGASRILFDKIFMEKEEVHLWNYHQKDLEKELDKSKIYSNLSEKIVLDIIDFIERYN